LVVGGVDLTGALHVLQLRLSPPLSSSLAPIKLANPGSPGKMTVIVNALATSRVCFISSLSFTVLQNRYTCKYCTGKVLENALFESWKTLGIWYFQPWKKPGVWH